MKVLAKYWKVLVALLLIAGAVLFYFQKYRVEKKTYESQTAQLNTIITALEQNIEKNMVYADVQDKLADAEAEINASRQDLYKAFPVEMKEEDQIMYVLYLETIFKEEIFFSFNSAMLVAPMYDGAEFQILQLNVNYKTTYQGFQNMINYLATDSRVASIYDATIDYNAEEDVAQGRVTLWLYLMDTGEADYQQPDIAVPETGKDNIFDYVPSDLETEDKNSKTKLVWISGFGSKYHSDCTCSNINTKENIQPYQITLEQAKKAKLTECPKCH